MRTAQSVQAVWLWADDRCAAAQRPAEARTARRKRVPGPEHRIGPPAASVYCAVDCGYRAAAGSTVQKGARVTRRIWAVLAIVLCGAVVDSCSDPAALLRRHTYPPNFKYITREQLDSSMWKLADEVAALDALMRQPGAIDTARRTQIERLLLAMLDATTDLQVRGRPTNHPLIGEHLERFQHEIGQALTAVRSEPPSYYLVGSVSGSCLPCHSPQ